VGAKVVGVVSLGERDHPSVSDQIRLSF
jgi:hypothetical protein